MYVRLFSAIWLLLCAWLAVVAWGFQAPFAYDPVGPRAYPLLLLGLMGAGSLWLIIKPGMLEQRLDVPMALRSALCVVVLLAYALTFELLGFVVSTALATFALGLLFTGRPLPCAISAVLMGVLLYSLFDLLLDVPLPLGLLDAFVES
ncbi:MULTISPECIES: tripartite tricarboxylate transporter TctB family protein [Ectopseudomonas]|jgi:putative tricarboxylic transport membrane protein|uniref:Putative tricarboxylic transport membrane protein n=1 Tax=Ectopseudomonas guguanensis TaxID=1198456 RepID=A0A1H0KSE2_9GAMM|nr:MULTISPECIES: tripartite tricarboxylate transporter TctB family protein [Pseudomonas]MDH2199121.1 tripartite tricarboxylate transporter TctB family protein [Pseudomonas oleovorans]MPT18086.1 tripartite tricarboxylate transporter TctB family protein [Pseudomonas sp.]WJH56119.1 tripartite tricarboxylate transporter TctB family protein [Pseudomonas guguanensis]SDO58878.1 putative tricarboxylic transport membrane protein [Pseudomonas guguanensis]